MQPSEIRVFAFLSRTVRLVSLAFCTARLFVSLLLLTRLFTVSFRGCGFAWSSDDALLSNVMRFNTCYDEAVLRLRAEPDLDPAVESPFFW